MDYEKILQELRQEYADLEQHAEEGSREQSTYHQIVHLIDQSSLVKPPLQRAFIIRISLTLFADTTGQEERPLVHKAIRAITEKAQLSP